MFHVQFVFHFQGSTIVLYLLSEGKEYSIDSRILVHYLLRQVLLPVNKTTNNRFVSYAYKILIQLTINNITSLNSYLSLV